MGVARASFCAGFAPRSRRVDPLANGVRDSAGGHMRQQAEDRIAELCPRGGLRGNASESEWGAVKAIVEYGDRLRPLRAEGPSRMERPREARQQPRMRSAGRDVLPFKPIGAPRFPMSPRASHIKNRLWDSRFERSGTGLTAVWTGKTKSKRRVSTCEPRPMNLCGTRERAQCLLPLCPPSGAVVGRGAPLSTVEQDDEAGKRWLRVTKHARLRRGCDPDRVGSHEGR